MMSLTLPVERQARRGRWFHHVDALPLVIAPCALKRHRLFACLRKPFVPTQCHGRHRRDLGSIHNLSPAAPLWIPGAGDRPGQGLASVSVPATITERVHQRNCWTQKGEVLQISLAGLNVVTDHFGGFHVHAWFFGRANSARPAHNSSNRRQRSATHLQRPFKRREIGHWQRS